MVVALGMLAMLVVVGWHNSSIVHLVISGVCRMVVWLQLDFVDP